MLPQIRLDRRVRRTLHEQLADQLRRLILSGELAPGFRLPPTRRLAEDLGVSRNVAVLAYEQLQLEGYLTARVGSGTRVPETLPEHLLGPASAAGTLTGDDSAEPVAARLSRRGERLLEAGAGRMLQRDAPRPFRPGVVAPDLFPAKLWGRLAGRVWRRPSTELVPYGDPAGHGSLREAIARHLTRYRAVRCDADRVVVTTGSQQALDIMARLLLDAGDRVAVEEPGYPAARAVFRGAGAELVGIPVDREGVNPAACDEGLEDARLIYTTPSHQYPLGVTLPLERRLRLLETADRTGAWIVEDDYDSEFRYESRPLPSLQGLDRRGRVIYVGSFSKVLAPGLRVGYVVLPEPLVEPFVGARTVMDYHVSTPVQAILAEFMGEGHLERHIARLRTVYERRWRLLRDSLDALASGPLALDVLPGAAGLHLTALLPDGVDDRRAESCAAERGIDAPALSRHYLGAEHRSSGLVLGFGVAGEEDLREGVRVLRRVLERVAEEDA
ncbi:MAG: PLP-dependent aminotransferase family protein [Gemmatimonadota bacterium]